MYAGELRTTGYDTTVRLQYYSSTGDEAYAGTVVDPDPLTLTDLDWTRQEMTLALEHSFSRRFRLGLTFPFLKLQTNNRTLMREIDSDWELGDVGAFLIVQPWEDDTPQEASFLSARNIQILLGATFPSGDERNGQAPALHFTQAGSGSIDPRFGIGYFGRLNEWIGLFADGSLAIDGGSDGNRFRNGNVYQLRIGGVFTPHEMVAISIADETIIRYRNYQSGSRLSESGGEYSFIVPRVALYPYEGLFIDGSAGIPVYRHVNAQQPVAALFWSVAAGYRF